jgi:uncharacterized membrane protein YbhN (UPF0104 family)
MHGVNTASKPGEAAAYLLGLAVAGALVYSSAPLSVLSGLHLGLFVVAALAYGAGAVVGSLAWVLLLCTITRGSDRNLRPGFGRSLAASLAGLLGTFTPMNLGTDLRRSRHARTWLGIEADTSAAANTELRRLELQVTLVASVLMACSFLQERSAALPVFRRKPMLPAGYGLLAAQFILQWLALGSCIAALGMEIDWLEALRLYVVLHILAKTPGLPQGMGLVEVGGLFLLDRLGVSQAQGGALLLVWDFVRLFLPPAIGALASTVGPLPPWRPWR